ncbi:MAG: HDOD domain-containing protein [Anaerohalosphaeraceae bacterium]|nr:HDOD domain-containing protein [Anaerohalosphaeraceae bacterium]
MDSPSQNFSAHRVTIAIRNIDSFAVSAMTLANCLKTIADGDTDSLSAIIESDPALAFNVIKLCSSDNIHLAENNYSIANMMGLLSTAQLTELLLNTPIAKPQSPDTKKFVQLNFAKATAAKLISEAIGKASPNCCYIAALLCGTGRAALEQLYPKSLELITQKACEQNISLLQAQRSELGIDEILIAKRLAEKLHLSAAITEAIWLSSTSSEIISAAAEDTTISRIISLASAIAASAQTLSANSYEIMAAFGAQAEKLSLSDQQISLIYSQTQNCFKQNDDYKETDSQESMQLYYKAVKDIALKSAQANTGCEPAYTRFVKALTESICWHSPLIEAQEIFGQLFCDFFNVEKICVYTLAFAGPSLQAVTIDKGFVKSYILSPENDFSLAPAELSDLTPWLFEQIQPDFKLSRSKSAQLKTQDATIGGLVYETAEPNGIAGNTQNQAIDFAAEILSVVASAEKYKFLAERLANLNRTDKIEPTSPPREKTQSPPLVLDQNIFESVAELAAGAAHELNNPLTVISGRIQMLCDSETDETKKAAFKQITSKVSDVEQIVGQLMEFARPAPAEIRNVSPFILINNCLEKVAARYGDIELEITTENIETLSDVKIDTEQVSIAISEIIFNSLESYESGHGLVKIIGSEQPQSEKIQISISDNGCGMSETTLAKSAEPFYSDKPAGRQRGMGLTIAKRLLQNNACSIEIHTQLDQGTAIIITLPK